MYEYQKGGFYLKKGESNPLGTAAYVLDGNFELSLCGYVRFGMKSHKVFSEEGLKVCGPSEDLCSVFGSKKPAPKRPGQYSTVWDWALLFCIDECWDGRNQSERSLMDALVSYDFVDICSSVPIDSWDEKSPYEIQVFGYRNLNELARNALFWAYRHGYVNSEFFSDDGSYRDMTEKFCSTEPGPEDMF